MSAAGCQPDTAVLYRVHSGMPEHTTGCGFAPERVASAAPEAVELCALTSDVSRRVERRHLARAAVGPADIRKQKDIVRRNNCAYVERFLLDGSRTGLLIAVEVKLDAAISREPRTQTAYGKLNYSLQ